MSIEEENHSTSESTQANCDDAGRGNSSIKRQYEKRATLVHLNSESCEVFIGPGSKWYPPKEILKHPRAKDPFQRNMLFASYLERKLLNVQGFKFEMARLRGKILGCLCDPEETCHGEVLLAFLNE